MVAVLAPPPLSPIFSLFATGTMQELRLHTQGPRRKMTDMMEWMNNFEDEIGQWIERIDFGDIIAKAQQDSEQQIAAMEAPPAEEATNEAGGQQPPYMEAGKDYALRAISLVQQALLLMNEAFRARPVARAEEIAKLKATVARLEADRDTRPASSRVVIDNSNKATVPKVVKKPRAPRKKGTASQKEARRAHRALNARKWRTKRREEERQKEAEGARRCGLWRSNRTIIVLDD